MHPKDDESYEEEENDSKSSPQRSFVIYNNYWYIDESHNAPLHMLTSEIIDNNEECHVDMFYDKALNDSPILLNNPPC
jgi:hypothetical protein